MADPNDLNKTITLHPALDADHLAPGLLNPGSAPIAGLPRRCPTGNGTEGGTFESWFSVAAGGQLRSEERDYEHHGKSALQQVSRSKCRSPAHAAVPLAVVWRAWRPAATSPDSFSPKTNSIANRRTRLRRIACKTAICTALAWCAVWK